MSDPVTAVAEAVAKSAELANTIIKDVALPVIEGMAKFAIGAGESGEVKSADNEIHSVAALEKWVTEYFGWQEDEASHFKFEVTPGPTQEQSIAFVKVYMVSTSGKDEVLKRVGASAKSKKDVRIVIPLHVSWNDVTINVSSADGAQKIVEDFTYLANIEIRNGGSVGRYYNWQSEKFTFTIDSKSRSTGAGPIAQLDWSCVAPGGFWIACPSFDKRGTILIEPGATTLAAEGETDRSFLGF
jgi:hypothetical protein